MFNQTAVKSLLDTDFYVLTMLNAWMRTLPDATSEWEFKCRADEDLTPYVGEIRRQLGALSDLYFTDDQIDFLRRERPFLPAGFLNFLRGFRLDPNILQISTAGGQLSIRANGPLIDCQALEMPTLCTVASVRAAALYPDLDLMQVRRSTQSKIDRLLELSKTHDLAGFQFMDYGTRRRTSYEAQYAVVDMLAKAVPQFFIGTSNPHIARELGLNFTGTMAHAWLQSWQGGGKCQLVDAQKEALEKWVEVYRGDLGIALTDVVGIDSFCRDLDKYFAKLYDGFRHDSGSPTEFGDRLIARLEELGVNPQDKTLVFSDGLDFDRAVEIFLYFKGRIKTSFGIGTWLSGDFNVLGEDPFMKPLNIVFKMVSCNNNPTAKISDSPGKTMCKNEGFLRYLMDAYKVPGDAQQKVLANL